MPVDVGQVRDVVTAQDAAPATSLERDIRGAAGAAVVDHISLRIRRASSVVDCHAHARCSGVISATKSASMR